MFAFQDQQETLTEVVITKKNPQVYLEWCIILNRWLCLNGHQYLKITWQIDEAE